MKEVREGGRQYSWKTTIKENNLKTPSSLIKLKEQKRVSHIKILAFLLLR